jgi:nicotinamide mononucleotide transporter
MNWIIDNWIEIVAVATGLAYIILSVKQNIWCWLFGIISSFLYLYVFFNSKIYADMSLQAYYVIMGVYGWVHWARLDSGSKEKKELPVLRLTAKEWLILSGITFVLFILIAQFLIYFTDSPVPWVDSFTTSLSFTATWMLTRKIIEHWIIWIVVDAVSIGLYFYRGLYPSIILFAVLTILAVAGYIEWNKEWKKQHKLTKGLL